MSFDGSNIIINFSIHMYAKRMILHSFERGEWDLSNKLKIAFIESLDPQ